MIGTSENGNAVESLSFFFFFFITVVCLSASYLNSSLDLDINKFLWMVRIGGSTEKGQHIKEHDYYTSTGEFRIDKGGSQVLLNCLMYKMCYYRFGSVYTEQGGLKSCLSLPNPLPPLPGTDFVFLSPVTSVEALKIVVWLLWLCFFVFVFVGKPTGYDRVRNAEIGNKVTDFFLISV